MRIFHATSRAVTKFHQKTFTNGMLHVPIFYAASAVLKIVVKNPFAEHHLKVLIISCYSNKNSLHTVRQLYSMLFIPVGKLWVSAVKIICLIVSSTINGLASQVVLGSKTGTVNPHIAPKNHIKTAQY